MQGLGQLALAGALGVTLCSCAQQQAQIAAQPQAQITPTNGQAAAQCQKNGVTPGTPAYDRCLANVEVGDAKSMNKEMGF